MNKNEYILGVCLNQNEYVGGGFQQQLSTIIDVNADVNYESIVIVFDKENTEILKKFNIKYILINESILQRYLRLIMFKFVPIRLIKRLNYFSILEKAVIKNNINLIYFLSPSGNASYLLRTPYIFTVWDLCHRDHPSFPEVSYYHSFEQREKLYQKTLPKASAIITDSIIGKKNIINRYCVDEDKVFSIYFKPSLNVVSGDKSAISEKYDLGCKYLFYPANIWPHKNHIYILDALLELKRKGIGIKLFFSGKDEGNLKYVLSYANKLGVGHMIEYLGYVPGKDLFALYKNSVALVMPSYFGPTNIPPLEALYVGTPVICSDLPGFRELLGDAALYCDLKKTIELVNHVEFLLENESNRLSLISSGAKQLKSISDSFSNKKILNQIIEELYFKHKCGVI